MSAAPITRTLDLRKSVERRVVIEGQLALKKLDRIQTYLCDDSGAVEVNLSFGKDFQGIHTITGSLLASIFMQCQRCLESVAVEVSAVVNIGVGYTDDRLKALPAEYDPLRQETPELDFWGLIEDELILTLPIVALHSSADCSIDARYQRRDDDADDEQATNPFSVLAAIKGKNDQIS